jgi:hypothetical protein
MGMKLPHNNSLALGRMAQIDRRLFAARGTTSDELASREAHVNPAALFIPLIFRAVTRASPVAGLQYSWFGVWWSVA